MSTSPTGPAVTSDGASCRLRPSSTAMAVRLDGLRARDAEALNALLAQLPEPPWDAEVREGDPLAGLLEAAGFERYSAGALMARPVDGIGPPPAPGATVYSDYQNVLAAGFTKAEARALQGTAALREMGSPSGYEWGEGQGAFVIARHRGDLVGFAHADLPDGIIDWMGVVPEHRRTGIGTALVAELAERVRAARGTHLMALAEADGPAQAFLRALGFQHKGGRTLLIRRA